MAQFFKCKIIKTIFLAILLSKVLADAYSDNSNLVFYYFFDNGILIGDNQSLPVLLTLEDAKNSNYTWHNETLKPLNLKKIYGTYLESTKEYFLERSEFLGTLLIINDTEDDCSKNPNCRKAFNLFSAMSNSYLIEKKMIFDLYNSKKICDLFKGKSSNYFNNICKHSDIKNSNNIKSVIMYYLGISKAFAIKK